MKTFEIAELTAEDRFPPATLQAARYCIVDAVTALVAGSLHPAAVSARAAALKIWGSGPSTLWFDGRGTQASGALFAGVMAASIYDIDDGHRAAAGHPGAPIISAVLLEGSHVGASATEMLRSIVLGYEVGLRIAAARDVSRVESLASGRWCGQGVAVALGCLHGLPPNAMAHAIAIAGGIAPNAAASEYSRVGNHVKEAIPFAAVNGLMSVAMAKAGLQGQVDLLDHPDYFLPNAITAGWGERWLIETTYFKPYSCCRWIHAPLDVVIEARQHFPVDAIRKITVETFGRALTLNNHVAPQSLPAAQYSIPFCVAAAFVHGEEELMPLNEEALLRDQRVLDLASKVVLKVDADFDMMFPKAVPARVTIEGDRGEISRTVLAPRGGDPHPVSIEEVMHKFDIVARRSIDRASAERFRRALDATLEDDFMPLANALSRSVGPPQA